MMAGYQTGIVAAAQPELMAIIRYRIEFSSIFHAHYVTESRAVDALRSGLTDPEERALADRYCTQMREIFLRHSALIQAWPPDRILSHWQDYRRDSGDYRNLYLTFLAWEEAVIHPLLERHAAVSERRTA